MWNTDDPKLERLAAWARSVPTTDPLYQRSAAVADGVFAETIPDNTNGATNYHTPDVHPDWSEGKNAGGDDRGPLFLQIAADRFEHRRHCRHRPIECRYWRVERRQRRRSRRLARLNLWPMPLSPMRWRRRGECSAKMKCLTTTRL